MCMFDMLFIFIKHAAGKHVFFICRQFSFLCGFRMENTKKSGKLLFSCNQGVTNDKCGVILYKKLICKTFKNNSGEFYYAGTFA